MKIKEFSRLLKMAGNTKSREVFKYRLEYNNVKGDNINLLWKMYKLIVYTDYTPNKVRDTFYTGNTHRSVAKKYGVVEGTIKKELYDFFTKKVSNDIGRDGIIDDLIDNKLNKEDVIKIDRIVEDLLRMSNFIVDFFEDNFSINIFDNAEYNKTINISDEDFEKIRNKIIFFSIPWQIEQKNLLSKEHLGYVEYLLTSNDDMLSKIDIDRKKELIVFLRLKESELID